MLRTNRFSRRLLPSFFGDTRQSRAMRRIATISTQVQIGTQPCRFELNVGGHSKITGNDTLTKTLICRKRSEQLQHTGKSAHRHRSLSYRIRVAESQVGCESLPVLVSNTDVNFGGGEDFLHDVGVCIAVRNDGADITGDAEALKDCFVKRNVTVLRTHERSIDIEKHQPFHSASEYWQNSALLSNPRDAVSRHTTPLPCP